MGRQALPAAQTSYMVPTLQACGLQCHALVSLLRGKGFVMPQGLAAPTSGTHGVSSVLRTQTCRGIAVERKDREE